MNNKKKEEVRFNWTWENTEKVKSLIEEWVVKYAPASCSGEGIAQNDNCQIYAPELVGDIVDAIEPKWIDPHPIEF